MVTATGRLAALAAEANALTCRTATSQRCDTVLSPASTTGLAADESGAGCNDRKSGWPFKLDQTVLRPVAQAAAHELIRR